MWMLNNYFNNNQKNIIITDHYNLIKCSLIITPATYEYLSVEINYNPHIKIKKIT